MRIVHHLTEIRQGAGGVPRAVVDLATLSAEVGHRVTLLTAAGSEVGDGWDPSRSDNFDIVWLETGSPPLERLSVEGLKRAQEVFLSADLLHLHVLWQPRNHQLAAAARRLGVPYVVSLHGGLSDWAMSRGRRLRKMAFYRLFGRRYLAAARLVHFSAAAERENARAWLPHQRVVVVPLAMRLEAYTEDSEPSEPVCAELPPGTQSVLMLGRVHPHKRPELAIRALAEARRNGVEAHLLLAGEGEPGYVARLRGLAAREGIGDATHFLGLVTGERKASLCRQADLMIAPSEHESFGLAVFESLASATPVVTTRDIATWRHVSESGGGRIVEPCAKAFASAIGDLLGDPARRCAMGQAGREWVLHNLAPRAVIGQYEEMYEQVLSR